MRLHKNISKGDTGASPPAVEAPVTRPSAELPHEAAWRICRGAHRDGSPVEIILGGRSRMHDAETGQCHDVTPEADVLLQPAGAFLFRYGKTPLIDQLSGVRFTWTAPSPDAPYVDVR